jgi:XTP/dITP diphosphohydrolase
MTIWFASGNTHKKNELAGILRSSGVKGIDLKIPAEAGLDFEPEENGNSFLENSFLKAGELYRLLEEHGLRLPDEPIIADDSGLCVDALGGKPGIHSARYGGKDLDAAGKNALLLSEFQKARILPRSNTEETEKTIKTPCPSVVKYSSQTASGRSARFVCAMVLYCSPNRFFAAQECMEGELVKNTEASRGSGGFGYDPILFIPELDRTVAELSDNEKNLYSHRGKAGRVIAGIFAGLLGCGQKDNAFKAAGGY